MDSLVEVLNFYKNKTVLITGHTGFKGSWLSKILIMAGANVVGYSLEPPTNPSLFSLLKIEKQMISIYGDIRDFEKLLKVFNEYKPEIVFHLAAQPIVRASYISPQYTYDVNVMGTVNVCECIRKTSFAKSFLNITTDKVYENNYLEPHPFKENEKLDGFDPYSNSKSCSELVTHSYYMSFLQSKNVAVSTARAGNVIGGGDFAADRIIPDCVRSIETNQRLTIRNPKSTRPYQHVLEPLYCYLLINYKQYSNHSLCGAYNIGPNIKDAIETEKLVKSFFSHFLNATYTIENDGGPHEALFLSLDTNKMQTIFNWQPFLTIHDAVKLTADWYKDYLTKKDIAEVTEKQIRAFFDLV